jgi:hypothetical protein
VTPLADMCHGLPALALVLFLGQVPSIHVLEAFELSLFLLGDCFFESRVPEVLISRHCSSLFFGFLWLSGSLTLILADHTQIP